MITLGVGSARIFFLGGTWAVSVFCAFDFWNRVGNWSQPLLWILVWQFEIRMRYAASAPEPSSPCLQTKSKTHVWALESAMLNDCVCVLCFFLSFYLSIYLYVYIYIIYIYTCFFLNEKQIQNWGDSTSPQILSCWRSCLKAATLKASKRTETRLRLVCAMDSLPWFGDDKDSLASWCIANSNLNLCITFEVFVYRTSLGRLAGLWKALRCHQQSS